MRSSRFLASILGVTIAIVPVQRAAADAGDIVGGIIGGVVAGAIVSGANQRRTPQRTTTVRRTTPARPTISAAQRAQNREMQTALNYFGFPAGTPDGVVGRNTRAAAQAYQTWMGYPATGQLTEFERNFLVTSYQRALAGGPYIQQAIAQSGQGIRGLLHTFRDEMAGTRPTQPVYGQPVTPQVPGGAIAQPVVQQPQPVVQQQPQPQPQPQPVVQQPQPTAQAQATLPTFDAAQLPEASIASHCNAVSLRTSTGGGFATAATLSDPNQALDEQFCLARTYAIAEGEQLAGQVRGATPDQIAAQCRGFGPAMREHVAALSIKSRVEVLTDVQAFALSTGMPPAQLGQTARICLGVGYRTDSTEVALASGLLLAALGEAAYGELMGHHLLRGFGTSQRTDLAMAWFGETLGALDGGARAAFAPAQPERTQLIRAAIGRLNGGQAAAPVQQQPGSEQPTFVIPAFNQPAPN